MRILVTAGPTREYIDPVRFITNASSGRMGYAVAAAARRAGHEVTLLTGPTALAAPEGVKVAAFATVEELRAALTERFPTCDALVMAAAVGDFRAQTVAGRKIARKGGPIEVKLIPTEDVLAATVAKKQAGQTVIAFAVETGTREEMEQKARGEMKAKGADFVVVNTPEAMGREGSQACILSPEGVALAWGDRAKGDLADAIVRLLER
ncbi:MAG: phosphopantothenoylcysteine decarboxylase [Planctomycetota bacterium]|nr:phosphopantothenoylcysteine decarboxylase [Planctomycetota bacterium]